MLDLISIFVFREHSLKFFGEKLSEKEADEMIAVADSDGDGKVNFDEFMKVVAEC